MKNFIPNLNQVRLVIIVFCLLSGSAISAWAQGPKITYFTPSQAFNYSITILGTNLNNATAVEFQGQSGTISVTPSSSSPGQVIAIVPAGAVTGKLTLITPKGLTKTTTAFTPYVLWVGDNGNWNDPASWSNGTVPMQSTNVVISSGMPIINTIARCNNLINNSGLTLSSGSDLIITGIFQNLAAFTQSGGKITFAAPSGIQQIPALTFHDLKIEGSGTKLILGDITVNGDLTLAGTNNNLTMAQPTDILTLDGSISGEIPGRSFIGRLVKTRNINGAVTDNFGNIGISFVSSGDNWGDVVATRVTGEAIVNGNYQSIMRYWDIVPANTYPSSTFSLSLTWFDTENNDLIFPNNKAQAWRSEDDGDAWMPVGSLQTIDVNGYLRTITVQSNTFSKWGISDESNPLPVSWLYFNGKASANGNLLNWATASEKNSDSFIIERSTNGRSFEAIGNVKAAGNSNQVLTYSFTDVKPASEKSYYRLKQTDMDGTFSYSSMIVINNTVKKGALETSVYPNPFAESLNLQAADGVKEVRLIALDGKEVYRKALVNINNTDNVVLDQLPVLKPGMYLLQLHGANGISILKVTRQ